MAQWTTQTLLALFGGFFLAFVLLLPYVAWSYRKRGRLGIGHTIMALAFLVYSLALVTYTLLPQPPIDAAYCAAHQATGRPVWNPLQFLDDMTTFHTGPLGNPALQQVLFNIALFVPWSVFLRSLFGKGIAVAVGSGFLVSLVIETTQLTGVWFLLPCPYRLFDTGDLAANTLGALVGALLAAGLRLAPPGRRDTVRVGEPRPVTTSRRLLGMVLDLLAVQLLGAVLTVAAFGVELVVAPGALPHGGPPPLQTAMLGYWLPAVVLLLVVPLAARGATPGQRVVLLRPVPTGTTGAPAAGQVALRFLVGAGGYFALTGADAVLGERDGPLGLTALWLVVHAICAWGTREHRGLTGVVAGLEVVDTRTDSSVEFRSGTGR